MIVRPIFNAVNRFSNFLYQSKTSLHDHWNCHSKRASKKWHSLHTLWRAFTATYSTLLVLDISHQVTFKVKSNTSGMNYNYWCSILTGSAARRSSKAQQLCSVHRSFWRIDCFFSMASSQKIAIAKRANIADQTESSLCALLSHRHCVSFSRDWTQ